MKKFRTNPIVIEAVQWTVSIDAETEISKMGCEFLVRPDNPDYLIIGTLEGDMQVSPWDWIIKGVKGEFYPCKPDVFELTYYPVQE